MLLGTEPPALPGRVLVNAGELFGIGEGTIRVALSRMVAAGEVAVDDGRYRLVGPALLQRRTRQSIGRAGAGARWNQRWLVAVVVAERRAASARAELRDALQRARLAELREGVWLRPDNIDIVWPDDIDAQCTRFVATDVDEQAVLARWDLDGWARDARQLRSELKRLRPGLDRGRTDGLAEGFIVSAAVLRHFQADPLLPPALAPARWPGAELRSDYDAFDRSYRALLRTWLDEHGR
jgi:phenylacetic acid degradation operon negative regulatory protein